MSTAKLQINNMFRNKLPKGFGVGRRNSEKDDGPQPMDTDVNSCNINGTSNSQLSSSFNSGMPKQRPAFKEPGGGGSGGNMLDKSDRSSNSISSFGKKAASSIMKKKSGKNFIYDCDGEQCIYWYFLTSPLYLYLI